MLYHEALLDDADTLQEDGQQHGALLLAHVAAEVYLGEAFPWLFFHSFKRLGEDWEKAVPSLSLLEKSTRVLWWHLTGHSVTDNKEVWKPYDAAVQVRNEVAHAGHWPTADEARTSIDAVRALIAELDPVVAPIREQVKADPQAAQLRRAGELHWGYEKVPGDELFEGDSAAS